MLTSTRRRMGDPHLGIGYLRVSTLEQHLSPEAQRGTIESWARTESVRVAAWHLDRGVSGSTEVHARPGLGAALLDVRASRAGILLVARRDRLARDVTIAIAIERAVQSCGARVVAADGVANGDTPGDAFLRRILDAASKYERALVGLRTKAALTAKRTRNERTGTLPYGYTLAPDGRTLMVSPEEGRVVELVRALREGGASVRGIVAECGRRGLVSRSGRAFGKTQIERMLRRMG